MRFRNCLVAGLAGCLAGSVWAADRSAAIRAALGTVPESVARVPTNGVDGARFWNYAPRLERLMPLLKPVGNLPHKRSVDVKASALGIGFETLDRDTFDPKKTFRHLAESGVKWARCQTGWMKCEKVVGQYDFGWLDEVVDGLGEIGIETWFSVGFGHPRYTPCKAFEEAWAKAKREGTIVPGWARGWVRETPYYHGPSAMEGWRSYCKALARHFKGRVRVWEIWNEPEWFWWHEAQSKVKELGYRQAARDFAAFMRTTAEAIREEIPEAEIAFNLAGIGSGWMHVLKEEGVGAFVDIFGYHSYNTVPEYGVREELEMAQALFRRPDGRPVRVWQAESGRATGPSARFCLPSEYAQAKFVARRVLCDLREGAEVTSIFTVTDFLKYYEDGRDQFFGLINAREDRPKLGFATLQALGWFCDGLSRAPDQFVGFGLQHDREFASARDVSAVAVASFRRRGVPVFAFWQREHVEMTATPLFGTLTLSTEAGEGALPQPVLVDPVRGKVWDAKAYRGSDRIRGVVKFTGVFALDYPLILTDLSVFGELVR